MPADWRYAIRVEIARGGMGRVLDATDTVLGREVAVKEALSLDADALRRFQREVRITAKLEHPSIVPVHDAGTSPSGAPFYVMRKIGGQPLEELVAKHGDLAPRLALLPHIVAASHAIAHAHERGIVHRDIKPANILVGDLGETIVIDWGLAKAIGEVEESAARSRIAPIDDDDNVKTRAGLVYGTPGFMAPEQLRGAAADERSDVYALGATLYHLLARRPPHYAKDGAEMMKQAATGAPQPLRELAPGVPPELATIVDKALAHDAADRYPNARALAEDLQRFLTGQLVASHHYSASERLVRFVRKNRALVAVTTTAVLAIAVGGTLAIRRIVDARDRADAAAQAAQAAQRSAEDGLRKLTLTTARGMVDADPTRAVALISSLEPSYWRQVRAIAAAARRHGIAYGVAASPHTLSLETSRDGQRVLAAGDDGVVRVIELAKHTERELANVHVPAQARFADAERSVVVFHDRTLAIVDATTGGLREVTAAAPIAALAISGPFAYWIDSAHAMWRLDLAGDRPEVVNAGEPAQALATSPDGRWIAVAGEHRLLALDRTQPDLPPQELAQGTTRDLAWSADSTYLSALVDQDVAVFAMPSGEVFYRRFAGERYAIAFTNDQIFTTAQLGVSIVVPRGDPRTRKINGDYTLGLHEARGNTLVTANTRGEIAVIGPDDDELVRAPLPRLDRIATSSRSPWLVAAADGRLLVWNLDAIQPRRFGSSTTTGAAFASGDALVMTDGEQPAQWIDLRDGTAHPIGAVGSGMLSLVPAPGGARAVLIDALHHGYVIAPGAAPQDLGGGIDFAGYADGDRIALGMSTGEIDLVAGGTRKQLANRPTPLRTLAARYGSVAAGYADHVLWRVDLSAGHPRTLDAPWFASSIYLLGGQTLVGGQSDVREWNDLSVDRLMSVEKPVAMLGQIELGDGSGSASGQPLAITTGGVLQFREATLANVSPHASIADDGLVASTRPDGAIEIIDPAGGERWALALPKGRTFTFVQISPDGRRVLATTDAGVLVWTLDLPNGDADTASWLADQTNASARDADGPLAWR